MKICYVEKSFSPERMALITKANEIVEEFEAAGYDLSLRQLYYQFVARALIENTERSYKNLGSLIDDARLAGMIDWSMIVDRTRSLNSNPHWDSPADIVETCAEQFQLDKWKNQDNRVEVWVEKEAMQGILQMACEPLDVAYFCCRGYTSSTAAWEAAMRLKKYQRLGQETIIIHLGDHDPSGIDMSRDIEARFGVFGVKIKFHRIALNMEQVEEQKPPPNPAKTTDSRYASYLEKFGDESWELDALDPQYINDLITKTVIDFRDQAAWDEMEAMEIRQKSELQSVSDRWADVVAWAEEQA